MIVIIEPATRRIGDSGRAAGSLEARRARRVERWPSVDTVSARHGSALFTPGPVQPVVRETTGADYVRRREGGDNERLRLQDRRGDAGTQAPRLKALKRVCTTGGTPPVVSQHARGQPRRHPSCCQPPRFLNRRAAAAPHFAMEPGEPYTTAPARPAQSARFSLRRSNSETGKFINVNDSRSDEPVRNARR